MAVTRPVLDARSGPANPAFWGGCSPLSPSLLSSSALLALRRSGEERGLETDCKTHAELAAYAEWGVGTCRRKNKSDG